MARVQVDSRVCIVVDVPDGVFAEPDAGWYSPVFKRLVEDALRQHILKNPNLIVPGWVQVVPQEVSQCVT